MVYNYDSIKYFYWKLNIGLYSFSFRSIVIRFPDTSKSQSKTSCINGHFTFLWNRFREKHPKFQVESSTIY